MNETVKKTIRQLAEIASCRYSDNTITDPLEPIYDRAVKQLRSLEHVKAAKPEEIDAARTKCEQVKHRLDAFSMPAERYTGMLPPTVIFHFIRSVILGGNRCRDDKGNAKLDAYGAHIAYWCLESCIRKIDNEWHLALRTSNKELFQIEINHFARDSESLLAWAYLISQKVKEAGDIQKQHAKKRMPM